MSNLTSRLQTLVLDTVDCDGTTDSSSSRSSGSFSTPLQSSSPPDMSETGTHFQPSSIVSCYFPLGAGGGADGNGDRDRDQQQAAAAGQGAGLGPVQQGVQQRGAAGNNVLQAQVQGIDRQPRLHPHAHAHANPHNIGGQVHVTQPSSLPTSPIATPTPIRPISPAISASGQKSSLSQQQLNSSNSESASIGYQRIGSASTYRDDLVSIGSSSWDNKSGIRERNAAMCNSEVMADIHFLVSNSANAMMMEPMRGHEDTDGTVEVESVVITTPAVRYPAHKYVLAIGSSVFYAMFYGPLAETRDEIVVPDVEPAAFLKMLQYLYSDEIQLDEETVLATLHVAKKYIIPQLAKACVAFMESSLTARNACLLLSQSRIFDEIVLMERCWEVIDAQAEKALNADGFLEIDHFTLESILSRESLNCKELTIFNAALQWANAECERRDIDPTPQNLRAALGSSLQLIRVPAMDLQDFADGPAQTGLFSLQEAHDLFLHFTATNKPHVGYPATPRSGLVPQICHRFQSSAYRNNQWRYRGRCDSIQFMVDRRIFIVGLGLYGSSGGAATYAVHIELKRQGRILAENDTEFFSDGSSNTFHVYFDQPIQIDPEAYYTASAILDGLELSYFGQEGMTDVSVGAVTFQFQCSTESTNGTGVQGGQIPELIFYGPTPALTTTQTAATTAPAIPAAQVQTISTSQIAGTHQPQPSASTSIHSEK